MWAGEAIGELLEVRRDSVGGTRWGPCGLVVDTQQKKKWSWRWRRRRVNGVDDIEEVKWLGSI